jgi:hypothetical protein
LYLLEEEHTKGISQKVVEREDVRSRGNKREGKTPPPLTRKSIYYVFGHGGLDSVISEDLSVRSIQQRESGPGYL